MKSISHIAWINKYLNTTKISKSFQYSKHYRYLLIVIIFFSHSLSSLIQAQTTTNWIWANLYGKSYADAATSVTSNGTYIYTIGYYVGEIDFGNNYYFSPMVTTQNMFALKTDKNGNTIWAFDISSNNHTVGTAITCDNDKNVIYAGYTSGTSILSGTNTLNNPFPSKKMGFIIKSDTSGNILLNIFWRKSISAPNSVNINDITTDASNNIYVLGSFGGKYLLVNNDTLYNSDSSGITTDVFIIKLNPNGNTLWTKKWDCSNSIQSDIAKKILVHKNSIYFLAQTTDASVSTIVKLSANNGNTIWSKNIYYLINSVNNIMDIQKNNHQIVIAVNPNTGFSGGSTLIDNYIIGFPSIVYLDTNSNVTNIYSNFPSSTNLLSLFTDKNDNIILTHNLSSTPNNYTVTLFEKNFNFQYWHQTTIKANINNLTFDNDGNIFSAGTADNGSSVMFGTTTYTKTNQTDAFLSKLDAMILTPNISNKDLGFYFYPNPAENNITIYCNYPTLIHITDITGKKVKEFSLTPNQKIEIDLSHLNNGLYLLYDSQKIQNYKLVIQR